MPNMESNIERLAARPAAGAVRRAASAALRNRRLGLWAACMMEKTPVAAEAYADEIVALGLQRGGDRAIVDRIVGDFRRRGADVAPETLCLEAEHFTPRWRTAADWHRLGAAA